ncbi:MAG: lipoate--protein ligase family protein [Alicyclobacillaceae bacterium]|nr:lipoate--protein ligase family protein [Alicyclobacillaceae bacterium]
MREAKSPPEWWEDTLWSRWPRWRVIAGEPPGTAGEMIARDEVLGVSVARGGLPAFRLWTNAPCLVVSRRDLAEGRRRNGRPVEEVWGWPVRVRSSGGTAVPHGPGVLQFSAVVPRAEGVSIDRMYRTLCAPIQSALRRFGWEARFGRVPGAFCDGEHNLVVLGKKVAGTSQSWKGGLAVAGSGRAGYVLAHGTLWVSIDPEWAARLMNQFYRLVLGTAPVRADASTCLARLPGGEALDPADVAGAVLEVLREAGGWGIRAERGELTEEELRLGREREGETDPLRAAESAGG